MEYIFILIVWIAMVLISIGIAKNRKVDVTTATILSILLGIFGIAYALLATPKQTMEEINEGEIDQRIKRFDKIKSLKNEGLISMRNSIQKRES